ncbi:MAG: AraC family transcriptional regulator [Oscillospiraceae bacterium]|jgi:AraC-like DNA-binding protein|nr:AraC family transcriptional regulator [Oscillospiraceae bacterium]
MQYLSYNERKKHGTFDFPIAIYSVNERHPQYVMAFHWHMEYEIIRVRQGSFHMTLDEEQFTAKAGDIVFISGGTLHAGTPENCVYDCIVFDMNMLPKWGNACHTLLQRIIDRDIWIDQHLPTEDGQMAGVIDALFSAMESKAQGYQLVVQGCLYQLFGIVLQKGYYQTSPVKGSRNYKKVSQLKQALRLIEENYAAPLTLEQLSAAAGMSPKYFCRFFQEMTQHTPIEYLNIYRIERACYQLIATDRSVTEIAFSCGYNDLSYFIKTFKRYKGVTPKRYLTAGVVS